MRVPGRPVIRFVTTPPPVRPPCAGRWADWEAGTAEAVEACGHCPAREWCAAEADAVLDAGFALTGVWHGTVYGGHTVGTGVG